MACTLFAWPEGDGRLVDAIIGIVTVGFIVLLFGSVIAEGLWSDNWPFGHDSELFRAAKVLICGVGFVLAMLALMVVFSGGSDGQSRPDHAPGQPEDDHHYTDHP